MPINPALRSLIQKDWCKFKANLGSIVRLCLIKQKQGYHRWYRSNLELLTCAIISFKYKYYVQLDNTFQGGSQLMICDAAIIGGSVLIESKIRLSPKQVVTSP